MHLIVAETRKMGIRRIMQMVDAGQVQDYRFPRNEGHLVDGTRFMLMAVEDQVKFLGIEITSYEVEGSIPYDLDLWVRTRLRP